MNRRLLWCFFSILLPSFAYADVTVSGPLTSDTTWSPANGVYVLGPGVSVPPGVTLTIEPGTIVKANIANSSTIVWLEVRGRLVVDGTSEAPVHFTSIRDDAIGGDTNGDGNATSPSPINWIGLVFRSGSQGEIRHGVIRYSGAFDGIYRAGVFNYGGAVFISRTSFEKNFQADIYQTAGISALNNNSFDDDNYAIRIQGGDLSVVNNSFHPNTVVVNETATKLDLRNNWWGSETGPRTASNPGGLGAFLSGPALYSPWLMQPPESAPEPQKINPVIIVPGIMSTELLEDKIVDNKIWVNTVQIASSITDDFLDVLKMDESGNSINSNILTGEIIKELNNADYWRGLLGQLSLKYHDNSDLSEYPYDWRLDNKSSVLKLKEKIDEIKTEKGVEKVDLVAHSMGGLLVKQYLKDYGGDSINKFIDIATPHTGAPSSYKILMYGDNLGVSKFFDLININAGKIKEISQNMPAVYQLLPSQKYFDDSDNDYRYYVFSAVNGEDRLTFEETSNYLKATGRNSLLVDRANVFHQEIDDLNPGDFGVETYNIAGCGTPTIGQFYILQEGEHPIYNIRMINGDGTVPLKSAEAMSASKTYYVKNAQHALMPSTAGVKELISGLLVSTSTEFDISPFPNLNMSAEGCSVPDGKLVSFHSPVELHVYDNVGNHAGPDSNGDIENKINGVVYEVIGDNKFAYLPDGLDYEIIGTPTGAGTFDIRIQTVSDGEVTALSYWNELPVDQTNFSVGNEVPTTISNITASATLTQDAAADITKPTTEIEIKGNEKSPDHYISSVHVTLTAMDDNAGVLKTEYSLDDGQTWLSYNDPIHVNDRGGVKLMYKSTDRAGNVEIIKSKIINIIWPGNSGKKN